MRHGDGDGWHNDGKGQQGDRRLDNGNWWHDDGRHANGKGQQGDRLHDNGEGRHNNGKGAERGSSIIIKSKHVISRCYLDLLCFILS